MQNLTLMRCGFYSLDGFEIAGLHLMYMNGYDKFVYLIHDCNSP